eukprot:Amastigsp_a843978_14.p3 type:complete len:174 gc:universal Amastigsp_a843978_14:1020-499(-)
MSSLMATKSSRRATDLSTVSGFVAAPGADDAGRFVKCTRDLNSGATRLQYSSLSRRVYSQPYIASKSMPRRLRYVHARMSIDVSKNEVPTSNRNALPEPPAARCSGQNADPLLCISRWSIDIRSSAGGAASQTAEVPANSQQVFVRANGWRPVIVSGSIHSLQVCEPSGHVAS